MASPGQRGPRVDTIRAAVSDPALPDEAARLYDRLLDRLQEGADSSRRAQVLLLVVAGIIELLNRAAVSDVQLGGFTVTDLSVIRKVLPMVAAYLIYDITACSTRNIYSSRILGAINRTYRPALHKSRYAILAHPRGSSFFGPFSWHKSDTKTYKAIEMLVAVLRVGSMATPVVLLAYWFTLMFRAFGFEDPLVWLSAGVSGGFTALAVLVVIEGIRSNLISPSWTSLISVHRRDALDERAWRVGPLP